MTDLLHPTADRPLARACAHRVGRPQAAAGRLAARACAVLVFPLMAAAALANPAAPAASAAVAAAEAGKAGWSSIKASACKETDRMNDRREITCSLPATDASAAARRWQFKAMFSGGHDDTSASIDPVLNDQPLKCDDGSKVSLFGEDGNVQVHCQLGPASTGGQAARLVVLIKWNHAEFEDYDLLVKP